jgi:P-type Cu2+ transporter
MTATGELRDGRPHDADMVSVVLDVSGMLLASQHSVVEARLSRQPGVLDVVANAVAQTATVRYDPAVTSVAELSRYVEDCGFHCAGQSVPGHVCDPLAEPAPGSEGAARRQPPPHGEPAGHRHGEHDHGHDMAAMVADMRNRFLVAAIFSVPILLWSPIGRDVLGFSAAAPFGLRDDVWQLLLSLPVVAYSGWIFFAGAWRALRARTLDMMVLVAVAIGAGWLYSLGVTLTGGGEVFYEAATVLAAFVLLGHWFEMRARGGANDAIRALLDLAPPTASRSR